MANVTRVRIERKKDGDFKNFLRDFKNAVDDEGIVKEFKRKQYHESKSEKKRRKIKEAYIRRQKESR